MAEIWDIYNEERKKTGRTIERGKKLQTGEYHLIIHVWVRNSEGKYLIQKRSPRKGGMWAATGGSVVAGENTLIGAIREFEEENGILLNEDELKLIYTNKRDNNFLDVYFVEKDINLKDLELDFEEVSECKYFTKDEILTMIDSGQHWHYPSNYLDVIFSYK